MFRLFGFLSGVAVVLGGIYWLLPAHESPTLAAAPAAPLKASMVATPEPGAGTRPDRVPAGPDETKLGQGAAGSGEPLSFLPIPLPEPARSRREGPEQRSGGDPGRASTARTQNASGAAAEPPGEPDGMTTAPELQERSAAPSQGQSPDWQASDESTPADLVSHEPLRFLFWSPFRSERAARGFADQLSLATAVPVDVVRLEPGRYRVAFDYGDDAERLALLERIEQITGLQLSGDALP